MNYYYITSKYSLIPQILSNKYNYTEAFRKMFDISPDESIGTISFPEHQATMIYALPDSLRCDSGEQVPEEEQDRIYPLICKLLETAQNIQKYNKVVFSFCPSVRGENENPEKPALHIVIQEGDNLLLANSYPAAHFNTALYFLFLAIKRVQFNPEQTCIRVCGSLSGEEKETLEKYFQGVEVFPLEKTGLYTYK